MLWPFQHKCTRAGSFWLQFCSSDREGVIHSPTCFSMKTTSWAGTICAKLICCQCLHSCCLLPCWLRSKVTSVTFTSEPDAPTPFAQIGQGYLKRDLCDGILLHLTQVTMGQFEQTFVHHQKLQNLCRFR